MNKDISSALKGFDLDSIWAELSVHYDEQSLLRVKTWVSSLFKSIAGGECQAPTPVSSLQRPRLLFLDGLEESAWFDPSRFELVKQMEAAFDQICSEVSPYMFETKAEGFSSYFSNEPKGKWRVNQFYHDGQRIQETFDKYPVLGKLLDNPELPSNIGECQISAIEPGGRIKPHYGPVNGILVGHLALQIPEGNCKIRVGDTECFWAQGQCLVFDDTFEHEVWNLTDETRYVVLFNLWHPDLTLVERQVISNLYPKTRELLKVVDGS